MNNYNYIINSAEVCLNRHRVTAVTDPRQKDCNERRMNELMRGREGNSLDYNLNSRGVLWKS